MTSVFRCVLEQICILDFRMKSLHVLAVCCCFLPGLAVFANDVYVPVELQEWEEWVLAEHPNISCPFNDGNASRLGCVWIAELRVDFKSEPSAHLDFVIRGQANAASDLILPHAAARPINVRVNGDAARIGADGQDPRVFLKQGNFEITGRLEFDEVPRSITVPRQAVVVKLTLDKRDVAIPKVDDGQLWLQPQELARPSVDSLRIDVFRRLVDDIPQLLETRLRLTIDGSDRVESLGTPIFEDFRAVRVRGDLPIQITREGQVLVQVSRGVAWITILAIGNEVFDEFVPTRQSETWPDSEIWAFDGRPQHRTVEVVGGIPIDPNLVESPFSNKPTFRVAIDSLLQLTNAQRGDLNPKPSLFKIHRDIWLAFDGASLVTQDAIEADIHAETRLNANYPLGSVEVDGSRRLVTFGDADTASKPGITVHPSESRIQAVSVIPSSSDLSANGWQVNADSLRATLHIPPGWRLLWTTGIDSVRYSWLAEWWNLWDIFICVLIIVVLFKVGGWPLAGIVTLAILLSYQDHVFSAIGWLLLGLLLLLDRYLVSENAKRLNGIVFWVLIVPVAVISVYVAANNLRQAVYPQLDDLIGGSDRQAVLTQVRSTAPALRTAAERVMKLDSDAMQSQASGAENLKELAADNELAEQPTRPLVVASQTGPGVPAWRWDTVRLDWSGPVAMDQRIGLVFMPPVLTRFVYVVVALVHLLMLFLLIAACLRDSDLFPAWIRRLLPLVLATTIGTSTQAAFPDNNILDELAQRLTAAPACAPGCASLQTAHLDMGNDNQLRINLEVSSGARIAMALPASNPQTALKGVSSNAVRLPLFRNASGIAMVEVKEGVNRLRLDYELTNLNDLVIEFPIEPAKLTHDICCWNLTRNVESRRTSIVLNRSTAAETATAQLDQSEYEFGQRVFVERQLDLQLEPTVRTKVRVQNMQGNSVSLLIPLLVGETILDDRISVSDGHVVVVLDRNKRQSSWASSLNLGESLVLQAPTHVRWTEVWYLRGSDFWSYTASGITPSQSVDNMTMFKPRIGETLSLTLTQPTPIPGRTTTIENASLASFVGNRVATSSLDLSITASVVEDVTVQLPVGSELERVALNGKDQPLNAGSLVALPITLGKNLYSVRWRSTDAIGFYYETPRVELNRESRNIQLQAKIPQDRWVLFLGGPAIGSAVLFWGVVFVTVLVALALSYLPKFPLTKIDSALLAIGATLANIWALLFVALWVVSVWWRSRTSLTGLANWLYKSIQVALVLLTFVGLFALFITVFTALQIPPDMAIATPPMLAGDQLYATTQFASQTLAWFEDTSGEVLPTAWMFSLPFWVYQVAMLAWSLWLVFALTKWVRSTFQTVTVPSFWHRSQQTPHETVENVSNDAETAIKEEAIDDSQDDWQSDNPPQR